MGPIGPACCQCVLMSFQFRSIGAGFQLPEGVLTEARRCRRGRGDTRPVMPVRDRRHADRIGGCRDFLADALRLVPTPLVRSAMPVGGFVEPVCCLPLPSVRASDERALGAFDPDVRSAQSVHAAGSRRRANPRHASQYFVTRGALETRSATIHVFTKAAPSRRTSRPSCCSFFSSRPTDRRAHRGFYLALLIDWSMFVLSDIVVSPSVCSLILDSSQQYTPLWHSEVRCAVHSSALVDGVFRAA